MKITVISRWFNEAIIAPFFLNHYAFADEIIILLDEMTTDATAEIISGYPNTKIRNYKLPEGVSFGRTTALVTQAASTVDSGWIICPDTDEFVFPHGHGNSHLTLNQADGNLVYADMWGVYRHQTEKDLDLSLPTIWQRRHGDPNRTVGTNRHACKPIIVKSGLGINWTPGFHGYQNNSKIKVSRTRFDGVHWMMADVDLAVPRRMRGRRELISEENLHHGWGYHNFDITEEKIRADCAAHANDPQVF